jgi:TetR/AcrR family transcriptional repressor of nem operon
MPRVPEFDRSDVLDRALDLFWSNGYEATSISKLLEVMSLNRGSLYSTFHDKRGLFREIMAHYVQGLSGLITETLVETEDPCRAIRLFFYRAFLVDGAVPLSSADSDLSAVNKSQIANGCLLFNAISELSNTMPDLAEEAGDYLLPVRDLFIQRLSQAGDLDLLHHPNEVIASADFLFGMLAGCRTLCKMGFEGASIKDVIDVSLNCLFKEDAA